MRDITLVFKNGSPLYQQLYAHIADEITKGRFMAGDKLPSKQRLAQHLHISVSTVENAFSLLLAEGYLYSKNKSGYFVENNPPRLVKAPPFLTQKEAEKKEKPLVLFSLSAADQSLFPFKTMLRLYRKALQSPAFILEKGEHFGDEDFRGQLCRFLYEFKGISCKKENIVIASGTEILLQNLFLLFRGAAVALENPVYPGAYLSCKRLTMDIIPIDVDEKGMDTEKLSKTNAGLVFVTPKHQFPLGATLSKKRRDQLLQWAEETGAYIIEDDYDSEFSRHAVPTPALFSKSERVIYLSGFTKTLSPSLRLAYMLLPDALMAQYLSMFGESPCSVSRLDQKMLALFIEEGGLARHIRRANKASAKKLALLLSLLQDLKNAHAEGFDHGLHLRLDLKNSDEEKLLSLAEEKNIQLQLSRSYYITESKKTPSLLLGYAGLSENEINTHFALLRDFLEAARRV